MIKISYFFRKQIRGYHSIEELFNNIIRNLPQNIQPAIYVARSSSQGFFRILYNILEAPFFQQQVNHITGDVNYIAFLLKKKKTILTIHDLEIIKRSKGLKKIVILLFWFILPALRVKYITVISEFTKSELLKYAWIKKDKIKVIPNCIPGDIPYSPKKFNEEYPLILQVGAKHNKNIPNLIKALEGIPCKLNILGKITEETASLLNQYRIDYENFRNLSYSEVIELYKKSDLLAFVSTYEGFGLPIIEAQSVGRPVITSNITSMPEVAGDAAIFVNPFDAESIRKGILKITHNENLRNELIQKGLENVKRFAPKTIAIQYADLYYSVAGNTNSK